MLCSPVYHGCAGAYAGARRGIAAVVAAAVEDALSAFGGTRGPKPSDEAIWAGIAWRIGAENFAHAVMEKIAENDADGWPRRPAAAFQAFLDRRFPKPFVDAFVSNASKNTDASSQDAFGTNASTREA